ncbi:MAG: multidrug resistance efflux pump, partial [Planctomycetaceae bacterium]|nr:multidrug resistance efflux pump [Planctomycetaceae bacterium]
MGTARFITVAACFSILLVSSTSSLLAADDVDYVRQIKPIFAKKCYACHGILQQKSGLRLDTATLIRKGGASGEGLVPLKPDESRLIDVLTGKDGIQMPPEGEGTPLSAEELDLVKRW